MSKLIVKIGPNNTGSCVLEQDGVRTDLKCVTNINIGSNGLVEFTMRSAELDAELDVSDMTAAAILKIEKL